MAVNVNVNNRTKKNVVIFLLWFVYLFCLARDVKCLFRFVQSQNETFGKINEQQYFTFACLMQSKFKWVLHEKCLLTNAGFIFNGPSITISDLVIAFCHVVLPLRNASELPVDGCWWGSLNRRITGWHERFARERKRR